MTGNDAEFVHMFGATGPLLKEVPKASVNIYPPMGHSSLREADDLADEHYDTTPSFALGNGETLIKAGFVLLMLCAVGIGFGFGLYVGKHFIAP